MRQFNLRKEANRCQMTKQTVDHRTVRGSNVHEPYELQYWCKELGVTPERLKQLVAQHGVMVATIRRVLGK